MKFLFIHLGKFRDLIVLSHIIAHLKENHDNANVTVLVSKDILFQAEHLAPFDKIIAIKSNFLSNMFLAIQLKDYDVLIDCQRDYYLMARSFAHLSLIKKKIGYNFPRKKKPFNMPLNKVKEGNLIAYYEKIFHYFPCKIKSQHSLIKENLAIVESNNVKRLIILLEYLDKDDNWLYRELRPFTLHFSLMAFELIFLSKTKCKIENDRVKQHLVFHNSLSLDFVFYPNDIIITDSINFYNLHSTRLNILLLLSEVETEYLLYKNKFRLIYPREKSESVRHISFDLLLKYFREFIDSLASST